MEYNKVIVYNLAYRDEEILKKIMDVYESQLLLIGIDFFKKNSQYFLYSNCLFKFKKNNLKKYLNTCEELQVKEILIQSINNYLMMKRFDIEFKKIIHKFTGILLLAAERFGNYVYLKELFINTDFNAAVYGSLFNFTTSNQLRAKSYLQNYNIPFKVI